MAQLAVLGLASAGAVTGGLLFGPTGASAGWLVGSTVGSLLFQEKLKEKGPRLSDLKVQDSAYGKHLPIVFGAMRVAGEVIWATDIEAEENQAEVGGKGFGGGTEVTTVSYFANFAVSLCEGPIQAVRRVWADSQLIVDFSETNKGPTYKYGAEHYRIHLGGEDQEPDPFIERFEGVGNVPGYRGQAIIVFRRLPLADFGGARVPNITAEVVGISSPAFPYDTQLVDPFVPADLAGDFAQNFLPDLTGEFIYAFSSTTPAGQPSSTKDGIRIRQQDGRIERYATGFNLDDGAWQYDADWVFSRPFPMTSTAEDPVFLKGAPTPHPYADILAVGFFEGLNVDGFCFLDREFQYIGPCVAIGDNATYDYGAWIPNPLLGFSYFLPLGVAIAPAVYKVQDDLRAAYQAWIAATPNHLGVRSLPQTIGVQSIPGVCELIAREGVWGIGEQSLDWAHDPVGHRAWVLSRPTNGSDWHITGFALNEAASFGFDAEVGPNMVAGGFVPAGQQAQFLTYDSWSQTLVVATTQGIGLSGARLFKLDADTFAVLATLEVGSIAGIASSGITFEASYRFATPTVSDSLMLIEDSGTPKIHELSISEWRVVRNYAPGLGILSASGDPWYDPTRQAVWSAAGGWSRVFLNRQSRNGVGLDAVVRNIANRCGLADADLDVADLATETVQGYVIPRVMPGSQALEPMLSTHFVDCVESDWVLRFIRRGKPPALLVPYDELGAGDDLDSTPIRLERPRGRELELPVEVAVTHLDPARLYESNTQRARRQQATTGTHKVVSLEVPESLSPDAAAKVAWIQLRTAWVERDRFRFSLPPRYLALDPGDVVEVAQADPAASPHTLRLLQVTLGANLRLELEGVLQLDGQHAPDAAIALGGGDPVLPRPIPVPMPAEATLWNGPVLSPALDNDGGFFFLAGPRRELAGTDYRGAALFESVAGSAGPYRQLVANLRATPHFQTLTALPDIADLDQPWAVWDETTTLDLQLWTDDSLESLTEQEVLAGHNLLLIGRELVQFVTATSLGAGHWRVARLLRGRYGTERLMTGHRAFEPGFVALRSLISRAGGLDSRNLERWYKAVALGFDAGGVIPERFTNSSGALLPWAPCQVRADRLVAGQITLSWQRRTRFGGEWYVTSAAEVPLNETEERYEIDLKDPTSYAGDYLIGAPAAAVVRGTRMVSGARSLTLTDAELQAIYAEGVWVYLSTISNGKFLTLSLAGWTTDSGAVATDDAPRGGLGAVGDGVFPDTFCYAGSSSASQISQILILPPELALAPGDPVRFASWVASTASSGTPAGLITLIVHALDVSNVSLGSASSAAWTPTALNSWQNVKTGPLILPSGTVRLRLVIAFGTSSTQIAVTFCRLSGPWKASQAGLNLELFQISSTVGRGWGRAAVL